MNRIYLVPNFFGFANLGDVRYFGHVARELERAGLGAVHVVATHPTASLPRRALPLHEAIAATSSAGDRVHLIGHSSGGLDARLLVSPGSALGATIDVEAIASRVVSVVSVATPHRGTPSAAFFGTLAGKAMLRALSIMTIVVVRHGGAPLGHLMKLSELLLQAERHLQPDPDVLDEVFRDLLGELSPDRRLEVEAFFQDVGEDQALLSQLSPDAMAVFGATTADRPGVRYGSVVTRARRPGLGGILSAGLSPVAQSAFAWFTVCWKMASRLPAPPPLDPAVLAILGERFRDLAPSDNDGMVPTLSQPWGKVIRAVDADHLDVIGHYSDPDADPAHYDWFTTGTGFGREAFRATWADVVEFLGGE